MVIDHRTATEFLQPFLKRSGPDELLSGWTAREFRRLRDIEIELIPKQPARRRIRTWVANGIIEEGRQEWQCPHNTASGGTNAFAEPCKIAEASGAPALPGM